MKGEEGAKASTVGSAGAATPPRAASASRFLSSGGRIAITPGGQTAAQAPQPTHRVASTSGSGSKVSPPMTIAS